MQPNWKILTNIRSFRCRMEQTRSLYGL